MFKKASRFKTRDVTQINAGSYHRSVGGSKSVNVRGHYTSTTEINAQEYHRHESSNYNPVNDLYAHIAAGCMHNSADRVDAPRCHEETRKAVQGDIFSWICDGPSDEVLWLTGPAGTGKSAIMGTVSDMLKKKGQLAATYYFSSFAGSPDRMSKRSFVTTLAYQLQQCKGLDDRLSVAILAAVQNDPAIFEMSLEEQVERLVLQPLRDTCGRANGGKKSGSPMTIVVDGVDECGEGQYVNPDRSREDDQIEVLSALLQAVKDPVFPFRVVIASRPETWIRRFFAVVAKGRAHEIFLDDKYNPDDDIRLFLKSKFAELCRRHGINPLTWPTDDNIAKLVQDASGQFIYVATILRFISTPPLSPRAQLEIVLKIKPRDTSNPFRVLDALYTSIISWSRSPSDTVIQLKALQLFRSAPVEGLIRNSSTNPSAWTLDRLFEGDSGPATMLLELPSLVYLREGKADNPCDSYQYGSVLGLLPSLTPEFGWNSTYAFYHKSFLDYLDDPSRCAAAFPDTNKERVAAHIGDLCSRILKCGGPEVPIDDALLPVFQRCFLDILILVSNQGSSVKGAFRSGQFKGDIVLDDTLLSQCEPRTWLDLSNKVQSILFHHPESELGRLMDDFVHRRCTFPKCKPGCKLWRKAIFKSLSQQWSTSDGKRGLK